MLEVASLLQVKIHPTPLTLPDDTSGANIFGGFSARVSITTPEGDIYDLMQQLETHLEPDLVGLKQTQCSNNM